MNKINKLRTKIDKIDIEILKLLNKRSQIALDIGKEKKSKNLFRPDRQANILKNLFNLKFNKISPRIIFSYWRSIFFSQINIQGGISLLALKSLKKKDMYYIYDYFSQDIEVKQYKNIESACEKLISDENKLLIMPYPTSNGLGLWWTEYDFKQSFVVASLPFLINKKQAPSLVVISKHLPVNEEDSCFLYISNTPIKNRKVFLVAKKNNNFLYKSYNKINNTNLKLIGLFSRNHEIQK